MPILRFTAVFFNCTQCKKCRPQSQSLIVWSKLPLAIVQPSELQATDPIQSVCPLTEFLVQWLTNAETADQLCLNITSDSIGGTLWSDRQITNSNSSCSFFPASHKQKFFQFHQFLILPLIDNGLR